MISSGVFSRGDTELFRPLIKNLIHHDPFLVLADYPSYSNAQAEVNNVYRDRDHWVRMSILNVARTGKFSSDRSIRDYCKKIWKVKGDPVTIRAKN